MSNITCKFEIPTTTEWTSVEEENGKFIAYYNNPESEENPKFRIERFRKIEMAIMVAAQWAIDRTATAVAKID